MRRPMQLVRPILALAAVGTLSACSSSAASSATSPGSSATRTLSPAAAVHCGPAGARTLAAGSQSRVYVRGQTVLACTNGGGRPRALGSSSSCLRASRVTVAAVGGRLAAAALQRCGVDTGMAMVTILRLTDGHRLYTHPAGGVLAPESFTTVGSMAVGATGTLAWIAATASIVQHRKVTEVLARAGRGVRVLDQGTGIVAGSLRLAGTTVSWLHGTSRRTARIG